MQNGGQEGFKYSGTSSQGLAAQSIPRQPAPEPVSDIVQWNASEFIDHQKTSGWFFMLVGAGILVGGVVFALTRDILATVAVLTAIITFGVLAKQKPRTLTYALTNSSIKIGPRSYNYDDFKTFSVVQDGALFSIILEPVKRFMPQLTIYFDQADGEKIFDVLAQHLPHEERGLDWVDKMMRKIRF